MDDIARGRKRIRAHVSSYADTSGDIQTPVGMSAYFMHNDESVYPEPRKFKPERWIANIDPPMERNFVAFSRGSRRCIAPK
jgi:hypothetical protein